MRFHPPCSNGKEKDWESGFHYYGARYYWSETLTGWLSVDPMADKYPALSPYNYCAWNPLVYFDRNGDSITLTREAWAVLTQAFWSTFDGKMERVPFSYDYETGRLLYTPLSDDFKYSNEEQIIIDHFSSLCTTDKYYVEVDVIRNDFYYYADGKLSCLHDGDNIASGVTIHTDNTARVFISAEPLYRRKKDGEIRPQPYLEAYQTLSIMHEIGGHAYYHSQEIHGQRNNKLTSQFENLVRRIFKGRHGLLETMEINSGKASEEH